MLFSWKEIFSITLSVNLKVLKIYYIRRYEPYKKALKKYKRGSRIKSYSKRDNRSPYLSPWYTAKGLEINLFTITEDYKSW